MTHLEEAESLLLQSAAAYVLVGESETKEPQARKVVKNAAVAFTAAVLEHFAEDQQEDLARIVYRGIARSLNEVLKDELEEGHASEAG